MWLKVDVLLDNDDVDIDAISDIGYTALHSAAENGSLEMVQVHNIDYPQH